MSRPAIFKIEEEARQTQNVSPLAVQEVKESDLMRNFRIELETLTFFIQADHDEKLLYECSRVASVRCIFFHIRAFFAFIFLYVYGWIMLCLRQLGCDMV
jgi:hypothetical protein